MDPNAAREILQIPADQPLTMEGIDAAYQHEFWLRHPSRYPAGDGRRAAEAWRDTLGAARSALVAELHSPTLASSRPRRSLPVGAIVGIVAGAFVVVGAVVAGLMILLALGRSAEAVMAEVGHGNGDAATSDSDDVERYEARDTGFEFPAALELYADGRYNGDCSTAYLEGCWQSALFTEADCTELEVTLGFSDRATALRPDATDTVVLRDVVHGRAVPVVFGNDDFDYGWIDQVACAAGGA
ncbi:hypothetical protein GCM10009819_10160 [Agromyces tropicus]|uniref:J domain-containing protein n=1 Tax=Agromyces tropicus TaxID=555371 RepID=A0ABN2U3F2_9MICO